MTDSLRSSAIRGMLWTTLERLGSQLVQFFIGILIARQLMPEHYGLIGMLTIFIAVSQALIDSGFANALIRKQDRTELDFATAFYFNILVGLLLYASLFLSAPWIAEFFSTPILINIIRVYTISLLFNSLTIVQTAKLSINLNFKLQSIITLSTTIISGIVGFTMAINDFGVWSLVAQSLGASFLRCIFLWIFVAWRVPFAFSLSSFISLFTFGSKILVSSLINTIYENLYTIVIGKKFASADVGFFNRASQFAAMPTDALTAIVMKVNYPILSSMQSDNSRLMRAYGKLLRTPVFLLAPALIGLAVLSHPLVAYILGNKWLPCVEYLQILCIGYIWVPLTHINLNILYVKGRSDLVLKLELIKKPIAFSILLLSIPFGIKMMCIGKATYEFIAFAFNCYYTKKILNFGLVAQLKEVIPIILRAIVMGFGIFAIITNVDSNPLKLCIGIISGGFIYLLLAYFSKDESLSDIVEIVKGKYKKNAG